jgi:hypothetical protein
LLRNRSPNIDVGSPNSHLGSRKLLLVMLDSKDNQLSRHEKIHTSVVLMLGPFEDPEDVSLLAKLQIA